MLLHNVRHADLLKHVERRGGLDWFERTGCQLAAVPLRVGPSLLLVRLALRCVKCGPRLAGQLQRLCGA